MPNTPPNNHKPKDTSPQASGGARGGGASILRSLRTTSCNFPSPIARNAYHGVVVASTRFRKKVRAHPPKRPAEIVRQNPKLVIAHLINMTGLDA